MKKRNFAVLICGVVLIVVAAWTQFATAGNPPSVGPFAVEVDPVAATAGGNPSLNYSTGFEPAEGFALGYISASGGTPAVCGGAANPCWSHTTAANASLITPTIENLHPATGLQHLRLTHDLTTRTNTPNFGLGVDARFPRTADLSARPIAPNTVSVDIAISNMGGMSYRVQAQSLSQGNTAFSVLFYNTGAIYVLDNACDLQAISFQPTGVFWDTTGAYQNLTITMDPCVAGPCGGEGYGRSGIINYFYGGNLIYAGSVWGANNLEQFLVFGDNYPGSYIDVDNLVLQSSNQCGVCGDGVLTSEFSSEDCEPSSDANCPGRCIPPGELNECRCAPICTETEPCPVQNGENGPFLSSSGYYTYMGGSPFVSIDGCGTDFDAVLNVSSANTPNIHNASCSGVDGDPTVPCFMTSGSEPDPCVCMANPGEPILIWMSTGSSGRVPLGSSSIINIRKKSVCAGPSVGACCDTNGVDQGCTDNVTLANCTGADKVWTDQGKCVDLTCECIPDCTGRVCGDDGCGGSCGTCDDGNVCNGSETCNASGQCDPGTPLSCDDGLFCNGAETCNPSSGCVAGAVPCADNETCDEAGDVCARDTIPTVSQWGLIVLTIVLLVAAKVQFGRRRPA